MIICKLLLYAIANKRVGLDNKLIANSTCEYVPNSNKEALILSHSKFIFKHFHQKVNEKNQYLPSIYWIPKLNKEFVNIVTSALKLVYKQTEYYTK